MTTHLILEDENGLSSACHEEKEGDFGITLEQALDPESERHIDCVECHKVLTGGSKHMTLEDYKMNQPNPN